MKSIRFFLLSCFLLSVTALSAQHSGWLTDLKFAQTIAKTNNKLILVDFWATWCGPCKMMDADVWSTEEAAAIKKNFVPVKIDVDVERSLATKYNARLIPMLILMDHNGEVLHTYTGYNGKEDLLKFISNIPNDATDLYSKIPAGDSNETFDQVRNLGIAMQELSQRTKYEPLQRSFLSTSDKWFKKSTKLAEGDNNKINEIVLLSSVNDIHRDKAKKVIKEIDEDKAKYESTPNASLMYYVLLQAYQKNKDTAGYEYALSKLREQEDGKKYLSLLK